MCRGSDPIRYDLADAWGNGRSWTLTPTCVASAHSKWVVGKAFRQTLKRAELPAFRLYDLRHTFASLLLAASAPITYVSAQLGHANPTTTLRHYAKWIPSKGRRWIEVLDRADWPTEPTFGTKIWNQDLHNSVAVGEVREKVGEPSGTRTRDPLIKSQVLFRLS